MSFHSYFQYYQTYYTDPPGAGQRVARTRGRADDRLGCLRQHGPVAVASLLRGRQHGRTFIFSAFSGKPCVTAVSLSHSWLHSTLHFPRGRIYFPTLGRLLRATLQKNEKKEKESTEAFYTKKKKITEAS